MQFKRLDENIFIRKRETDATIEAEFLVPKEHSYKVGKWYDDIKIISANTTKDNKFTYVKYVAVKKLFGNYNDNVDLLYRLLTMVK